MHVMSPETEESITDILNQLMSETENQNHTAAQNDSKVYYFKAKVSPDTIINFLENRSKQHLNSDQFQNDSRQDIETEDEHEAILNDTNLSEMSNLPDIAESQIKTKVNKSKDIDSMSRIKTNADNITNKKHNSQTVNNSFEFGSKLEKALQDEKNELFKKISSQLNQKDNETEIVIDFYSYDNNKNPDEMSRGAPVDVQNEKDYFLFDKLTKIKNDIEEIKLLQKQQEILLRKSHNRRLMKTDSMESTFKPPNLDNRDLFLRSGFNTPFMYPQSITVPRHHVAIHQTWPIISNGNVLLQRLNYLSNKLIRPPSLRVIGK